MKSNTLKNPLFWTDGYKLCHPEQHIEGTEWIYETWTPRKSRLEGVSHAVMYGLQGALQELTENFDENFFSQPIENIVKDYEELQHDVFGKTNKTFANNPDVSRIKALHKLGYLPIKVKGLKEGTFVPVGGGDEQTPHQRKGVPMFTIENTRDEEFWLPGHLETPLSSMIWLPMTAATIADKYKRIFDKYAQETSDTPERSFLQGGDFSMRGMASPEAALRVSGGHLTSFGVSATIGARNYLKDYYDAPGDVIAYTPSTEHSVMCSYGEGENELEAFRHMMTNVYPDGNFTIVSDSYDFWNVIDNVLPQLREEVLSRDGKVIIRPDSGDPVKILCGDPESEDETVRKGLVQRLAEIFGSTMNKKGYLDLDPHIGAVYGDSITPERAEMICTQLKEKGFATTNVALGIGSYTYQYNTRDTLGFALKATAEIIDGEFQMLQKRPKTDDGGFKTSQKGMVAVVQRENDLELVDELTPEQEANYPGNMFEEIYENGKLKRFQSFTEIRQRVAEESKRVYGEKEV